MKTTCWKTVGLATISMCIALWAMPGFTAEATGAYEETLTAAPTWAQVRSVPMQGYWKAFWNVGGGDVEYNNREAVAHGFSLVNILGTYADYPGRQKENIGNALKDNRTNPWKKPGYFERIIRRNIAGAGRDGDIFVHDIEFDFEEDVDKAWDDTEARAASGATTKDQFAKAYMREWASWFWLPCQWNKEIRPAMPVIF